MCECMKIFWNPGVGFHKSSLSWASRHPRSVDRRGEGRLHSVQTTPCTYLMNNSSIPNVISSAPAFAAVTPTSSMKTKFQKIFFSSSSFIFYLVFFSFFFLFLEWVGGREERIGNREEERRRSLEVAVRAPWA